MTATPTAITAPPHVLVPCFERELLRMAGVHESSPALHDRLAENVRLAILFSGRSAIVPAPGFFETSCGFEVVRRFAPSIERGQLLLTGSNGTPDAYVAQKLTHWTGSPEQLVFYGENAAARIAAVDSAIWRVKTTSTDGDLFRQWHGAVDTGAHPLLDLRERTKVPTPALETSLHGLPDALDGSAMLVDNVVRRLPRDLRKGLTSRDRLLLRIFLARGFFGSYLEDSDAVPIVDSRLGNDVIITPKEDDVLPVRRLRMLLEPLRLRDVLLHECTESDVAEIAESAAWAAMAQNLLTRVTAKPPFGARELIALRGLREGRRRHARDGSVSIDWLKRRLEQQLMVLERAALGSRAFVPGANRQQNVWPQSPVTIQENERMSGIHVGGDNHGTIINSSGDGNNVSVSSSSADVLAAGLPHILSATNADKAVSLVASLESVLQSRKDITPEMVSDVIQTMPEAQRIRGPVREALVTLGTGASAGVLAQGIMLGLRTLIGA